MCNMCKACNTYMPSSLSIHVCIYFKCISDAVADAPSHRVEPCPLSILGCSGTAISRTDGETTFVTFVTSRRSSAHEEGQRMLDSYTVRSRMSFRSPLAATLVKGNPFQGKIPYNGKSLVKGNPCKGKSLLRGNPS